MNVGMKNIWNSLIFGITYFPNTVRLVLVPLGVGLLLGSLIALIRVYRIPFFDKFFAAFIAVYQGIPLVVALMVYNLIFTMKFNDIAQALHLSVRVADVDTIWVGVFALSLEAICGMAETIKGALLSIDRGQSEAGYSVGLTKVQTMRRIILPQVVPIVIPSLLNNMIGLLKGSSIAMAIGITEILSGALIPASKTYAFFEGYLAAAIIYWILSIAIEYLAGVLMHRTGKYRRKLA